MKTDFGNVSVAKGRDTWRQTVFPCTDRERHTVDANPLTTMPRSIWKHVAEVSFALLADNLRASWSQ